MDSELDFYNGEIGEFGEYVPSPDEIRRRCLEIRNGWTESERRSRAGSRNGRWEVPVTRASDWMRTVRARD